MCVRATTPGEATRHPTPRHATPRHATPHHTMLRCATLALLCAALAHAHEKRAEMSPVPFMMGSRYGRSPERMMSPRMDRFIMGSRYGKRSEAPIPQFPERGVRVQGCAGEGCAVCRYTDVLSLFKCVRSHTHLQFARRSTEEKEPGEVV